MEIAAFQDPIDLFKGWLAAAEKAEPADPDAMALATVGQDGQPSVRMVLMKGVDHQGFRFYTNTESRKAQEIAGNSKVAACFHWKSLQRQVRIEGRVEILPAPVADAYFKTRHYLSKLGAWASRQSQPLQNREELESRVQEFERQFKGQDVPRPPHWSGYLIVPSGIEFWQRGEGRLHDRFLFTKAGEGWGLTRLNP